MVKKSILILLNAPNESSAIHAIQENYPNENPLRILEEIKNYHAKIEKHFCSACWQSLQNKDSRMALSILSYFTNKNISVLPIHDSFIIDSEYSVELKKIMEETYSEFNNGFFCKVK